MSPIMNMFTMLFELINIIENHFKLFSRTFIFIQFPSFKIWIKQGWGFQQPQIAIDIAQMIGGCKEECLFNRKILKLWLLLLLRTEKFKVKQFFG